MNRKGPGPGTGPELDNNKYLCYAMCSKNVLFHCTISVSLFFCFSVTAKGIYLRTISIYLCLFFPYIFVYYFQTALVQNRNTVILVYYIHISLFLISKLQCAKQKYSDISILYPYIFLIISSSLIEGYCKRNRDIQMQ